MPNTRNRQTAVFCGYDERTLRLAVFSPYYSILRAVVYRLENKLFLQSYIRYTFAAMHARIARIAQFVPGRRYNARLRIAAPRTSKYFEPRFRAMLLFDGNAIVIIVLDTPSFTPLEHAKRYDDKNSDANIPKIGLSYR